MREAKGRAALVEEQMALIERAVQESGGGITRNDLRRKFRDMTVDAYKRRLLKLFADGRVLVTGNSGVGIAYVPGQDPSGMTEQMRQARKQRTAQRRREKEARRRKAGRHEDNDRGVVQRVVPAAGRPPVKTRAVRSVFELGAAA